VDVDVAAFLLSGDCKNITSAAASSDWARSVLTFEQVGQQLLLLLMMKWNDARTSRRAGGESCCCCCCAGVEHSFDACYCCSTRGGNGTCGFVSLQAASTAFTTMRGVSGNATINSGCTQ
jgi:hypothetical protein